MGFRVVAGTNIGADVVKIEDLTEAQAFAMAPSYIGEYDRVEIFNNFETSPRARWNRKGENLVEQKAAKKQKQEDKWAAQDKKSQDNKDRWAQDKSDASARKQQNFANKSAKQAKFKASSLGQLEAKGQAIILKLVGIAAAVILALSLFMMALTYVISFLSNYVFSWVAYPFYFLLGKDRMFDLSSIPFFEEGVTAQYWFDFLILLVVSVITVFIFYKIINFKNQATRARNISLAVMVYIVGSFITTNTNYFGPGLIGYNAYIIGEVVPFVKLFGEAEEDNKYIEQERLKTEEANAKKINTDINSGKTQSDINNAFARALKLEIKRLGNKANLNHLDASKVTNMGGMFFESKFNGDISKWDVSNVTNMDMMFWGSEFNGDISDWNVSKVTNMKYMFNESQFTGDISKWDVSNVTHMDSMFSDSQFNGDISKWDVSNVTHMQSMFESSKFNGDISKWDVSKVTNMGAMFFLSKFNGDISKWDVSNVTHMSEMFLYSPFNGDISKWDVSDSNRLELEANKITSNFETLIKEEIKRLGNNANLNHLDASKVTNMGGMFFESKFNGDISKWDVSKVTNMIDMFFESKFNGDISNWDVSKVKNMGAMFYNSQFNGDISNWDVSKVTDMQSMFESSKFNGDISQWDVSNVIQMNMDTMFDSSKFNGDISKWAKKPRGYKRK